MINVLVFIASALAEDSIEVVALPATNVLLLPLLKTLLRFWHALHLLLVTITIVAHACQE